MNLSVGKVKRWFHGWAGKQFAPAATIQSIFEWIPKVLDIIIEDQGRKDLVEPRLGRFVL